MLFATLQSQHSLIHAVKKKESLLCVLVLLLSTSVWFSLINTKQINRQHGAILLRKLTELI